MRMHRTGAQVFVKHHIGRQRDAGGRLIAM